MRRADYIIAFNNVPADDPETAARQIVDTIRDGCQVEVEVHFWPDDDSAAPASATVVVPGSLRGAS